MLRSDQTGRSDQYSCHQDPRSTSTPAVQRDRRDHLFFSAMSVAMAVVVGVGFSRTYSARIAAGTLAFPPLAHLHGALFALWMMLFIAQALLVTLGKTRWHRRVGVGSAFFAVAIPISGTVTAIVAVRHGFHGNPPGPLDAGRIPPCRTASRHVRLRITHGRGDRAESQCPDTQKTDADGHARGTCADWRRAIFQPRLRCDRPPCVARCWTGLRLAVPETCAWRVRLGHRRDAWLVGYLLRAGADERVAVICSGAD